MGMREAGIVARGLELHTRRGRVFGPTSFEAPPGSVTALLGASGTGKTALLLVLAARMRPSRGVARVCGLDVVRHGSRVRKLASVGLIAAVNDLEPGLTVRQHLCEQRSMIGRNRGVDRDVLALAGLLGAERLRARDLSAEQRIRLGLALALVGNPRLVVIDDLDRDLTAEQTASVGATLRALAADGLTIVAACLEERSCGFADSTVWATAPVVAPEEADPESEETARAIA